MHVNKALCTFLLAISLAACGGGATTGGGTPAATSGTSTEQAGTADETAKIAAIASEIKADPNSYDAILAKHNMTAADFEKALYDIAGDAKKSAEYQAALH